MDYRQAALRVKERSLAAAGRPADHRIVMGEPDEVDAHPFEVARRILHGLVDPDDIDLVLTHLQWATTLTIDLVCRADTQAQVGSNVYVALAQTLAMGMLLQQPEPAPTSG